MHAAMIEIISMLAKAALTLVAHTELLADLRSRLADAERRIAALEQNLSKTPLREETTDDD